ncbi:MAG: glycosyltransferase family 4 protein [Nitrospirae bacterium]|nr:glycosyltransferase family 4 protein [Nitrospirota bacterium]
MAHGTKERINVLHIIEALPYGGAENLLLTLARNIDRDRFNLLFCCLRSGGPIADQLKEEGFKVVCLKNYRMRFFYKKVRDLIRLINEEGVDVIQTHLIEANFLGRVSAYLSNGAAVCKTEHAFLPFLFKDCRIKQKLYLAADRLLDRLSDRIIYVSESQRNIVRKGKHDPARHVVIHNAVDEKRFSDHKPVKEARGLLGFTDKDIVIGTVARPVPHKGLIYLIKAVEEAKKKHGDLKLLVIGSGPEEAGLKKASRPLGKDVLFLAHRPDVPELMKSMDIYVQPSFWETFGITIAEAMFSGLPVIATDVGGIPEVVVSGETGILVPAEDSKALTNALFKLLENPALAKSMGERGRETAVSRFTGKRYAEEMERLYISLMEKR